VTYRTFLVGTVAIAGIPPLAGFFSKDEILAATFGAGSGYRLLWVVGLLTAGLTACYMFRAVFMTFEGEFRGTAHERNHLHESPPVMTMPLVVLAVGAVVAGLVGIPDAITFGRAHLNFFHHFLEPSIYEVHGHEAHPHLSYAIEWVLMVVSVAIAVGGILLARRIWGGTVGLARGEAWARRFPAAHRVLSNKYYVDELYDAAIVQPIKQLSIRGLWRGVDVGVIDGMVNGVGGGVQAASGVLRRAQTGSIRTYAAALFLGAVLILGYYLWP
jgi:NADH-quinone oxidoreductase subunit L